MQAQQGGGATEATSGAGRIILLAAAGVIAAILGLSLSFLVFGGGAAERAASFSLVDQTGAPANESLLEGRLSLVYFGFTHCPDICPTDLANAVAARDAFKEQGGDVQVVFVSVDPERDTPETLDGYVGAFGDDLIGLTGTAEQIARAAKPYGVVYAKSPPADPDDPMTYEIIHSTNLYAVGPDASILWRFPSRTPPEVVARRLRELSARI